MFFAFSDGDHDGYLSRVPFALLISPQALVFVALWRLGNFCLCGSFLLRFFFQPPDIPLNPTFRFVVIHKFLLIALESRGVVVAAAVDVFGWVVDVEHFVIDDVFDDVSGDRQSIERFADRDGFVGGIMVA